MLKHSYKEARHTFAHFSETYNCAAAGNIISHVSAKQLLCAFFKTAATAEIVKHELGKSIVSTVYDERKLRFAVC